MTKVPGMPSRGSKTGRPIMVLMDVLGQRWTLRILWELKEQTASFRDLRSRCDNVSPTLLNKRLKQLRDLKLVNLESNGYQLSSMGLELSYKFVSLELWANEWAKKIDE